MKRIILTALSLVLGLGIASAQAPTTTKPAVKTEKKEATVAPESPKSQPVKAVAPTSATKPTVKPATTQPSQNPKSPANAGQAPAKKGPATVSPSGQATKTKKDGTPDKRYKENQKRKKDGTPDMRYKENKSSEKPKSK
jgi:hypothetical protein